MKVNKLKLIAALFIIASIIALYLNNFKYNAYVLVLNISGVVLFIMALIKDAKTKS
ncbi:hypothetical protein [Psychroserpens sp.]|uniref:hypothetical protein n=1 Tax=Psychroserpens sp. TaxID=2020870 RepID=UPI0038588DF1